MLPQSTSLCRCVVLPTRKTPLGRCHLCLLEAWPGPDYFSGWPQRPRCGRFFGGCRWYGSGTSGPALACAAASSPEFDAEGAGCSREELRQSASLA